jgi:predicted NAD/FAD-dependent oxidoreductase
MSRVLGITELPSWASAHRWSLAKPMDAEADLAWRHPELRLGMAGDAWAGRPKVESAWLSGRALATSLR